MNYISEMRELIVRNKLNFAKHIAKLYRTASHKLHVLRKVGKYLTPEREKKPESWST